MVDIFHYKDLIITISQEQSFSKAAKKLHIPQPSLSVMVRKIEEEIGLPLFDRTSKPIRLTETGQEYLRCATDIGQVEKTFGNYIDAVSNLQTGTLRVGASQMLSDLVLPRFLGGFLKKYPGIEIQLTDDNSVALKDALAEGRLDLIIDNQTMDEQIFEHQPLRTEHLLLGVPESFPSGKKAAGALKGDDIVYDRVDYSQPIQFDIQAFAGDPFVLLTRENKTRQLADAYFRRENFEARIVLEVDRMSTNFRYIRLGVGDGFVTDTLVKNLQSSWQRVRFFRVPMSEKREVCIFYKRSRYYSRVMQVFVQELSAFMKEKSE